MELSTKRGNENMAQSDTIELKAEHAAADHCNTNCAHVFVKRPSVAGIIGMLSVPLVIIATIAIPLFAWGSGLGKTVAVDEDRIIKMESALTAITAMQADLHEIRKSIGTRRGP